jgi:uroporphyrinogen-III synthase
VTAPLDGLVVVVTRPAAQAARFAAMVEADGATPLLLPTIEIEPIELEAAARAALTPDTFDWIIYTSANAVESSLRQLSRPARSKIAAVGRGTARTLAAHGLVVEAVPRTTADSEGLLSLDCFADLRGQRVLILKGRGGRPLLREELARRGADVVTGDVYLRRPTTATPATLEALRTACDAGTAVITATSAEVLAGLLQLAPDDANPQLRDAPLLVPGPRVTAAARELGWRGRIIAAVSAEDAAMTEALRDSLGHGSHPGAA